MTARDYAIDYMLYRPEPKWMADERLDYCAPAEKKSLRSTIFSLLFAFLL